MISGSDTVTIALTRYKESDELLRQCLESIAEQEKVHARVLVLDQFFHLENILTFAIRGYKEA